VFRELVFGQLVVCERLAKNSEGSEMAMLEQDSADLAC
jgi:hypothetical protein